MLILSILFVFLNECYSPRVIPRYLIYRPANSVPYATVEADLEGPCLRYCATDPKGKLITQSDSEAEQKCGTFQHWIHQWTHGNLLVTQMEGGTHSKHGRHVLRELMTPTPPFCFAGVEHKLTNVRVVTKSKGFVSRSRDRCI